MHRIKCLNIDVYAKLYHGLIELYHIPPEKALDMLLVLNTANLDTVRGLYNYGVVESSSARFCSEIQRRTKQTYKNLIALYLGLEYLESNIDWVYLTEDQRDACQYLKFVMHNIRTTFREQYGMELDEAVFIVDNLCEALDILPSEADNQMLYGFLVETLKQAACS